MSPFSENGLDGLRSLARQQLPRLLTQVCRDPGSPFYGCFDRNWWHYKIRDFPSVILQQGAYALWTAAELPEFASVAPSLRGLASAGCRFWQKRALRRRAFEEYYPWEEGYPPLAFSTLAVMKMVAEEAVPPGEMKPGAIAAARQLSARFEHQAANQQVAGLAALAWLKKIYPDLVDSRTFADLSLRTLALQDAEGWFVEYDGPDLGYLAVTIDCLWDLFDATGDSAYVEAAARARDFINTLVSFSEGSIGMHNSRNTDYLVPYGLARFLFQDGPEAGATSHSFRTLFSDCLRPGHFFAAVDDRYWSHYIGHSLFRSLRLFPAPDSVPPPAPASIKEKSFPHSGYQLRLSSSNRERILISPRKGGILTVLQERGSVADFGWVVDLDQKSWVSHWWSNGWKWSWEGGLLKVDGFLAPHRETASDPWKHMALRLASLLLGRRLIQFLKKQLIFKNKRGSIPFSRTIEIAPGLVRVTDHMDLLPEGARVRRAPRSSKRHVASADSWHQEDLQPVRGFSLKEEIRRDGPIFSVVTEYRPSPQSDAIPQ